MQEKSLTCWIARTVSSEMWIPKDVHLQTFHGGQIRLHVESTDDTSILENMTNQFKPHSGSIVFKKGDEEAKMKELTWENGYITEFTENIDIVGSQPMTITFVVSAQVIKIGGAQFEQNWPK